jgi:hypothetical protein
LKGLTVFLFVWFRNNPVQGVEKTFQLTRATKDLLLKQDFEIQVGFGFSVQA